MTEDEEFESGEAADVVRRQSFDTEGPIELDLAVGSGRIEIRLVEEPGAHVEIRHDPSAASPWAQGMSSLVNWFSGQFGEGGEEGSPAEAIRQTRVDLSGGRLVVRTSKALHLRGVPVVVTVRAPAGSHVEARSGSANVVVTGPAGRLNLVTGSGEVSADRADGVAQVNSGSGAVRLGPMLAGVRGRTGSGDLEVSAVGGVTTLFTGSGDIWLGSVSSDVMARTGSGDVSIRDASFGRVELITGSGKIKVGIHPGTPAEIDLSSGSGEARSDLDLSGSRPEAEPGLRVRGRTGSGTAVVSAATE